MSLLGSWIKIQSYKHDGSFHRQWSEGFIIQDDADYFVIVSKRNKVIESNGRRWFTKEPAVTIFAKHDWFNVICMLKRTGVDYYCNLASPALYDKEYIKYIDYDLDLRFGQNGEIKVLDEDEFRMNSKRYCYSEDLLTIINRKLNELKGMMEKHSFPFNDDITKQYFSDFNYILKNRGTKK